MTHEQVHNKFKIFTGTLANDNTLGPLADEIAAFVRDNKVSAKSIGVEYLEGTKKLVLSLGYRTDGEHYPVKLSTVSIGSIGELGGADVSRLEAAMAKASSGVANIICHELYITDEGELLMVLMSEAL
jgi:hypothetical protein